MKKEFLILLNLIFLSACSSTSSNFTHIPLPSFKAHFEQQNESSDISVAVKNIEMQRINQYSKDFEDSILKIRLDKEIELLVKNLQKDSEKLLASKGFVVNNTNATYTLYHKIDIYIQESDMNKKNQWLSGEELSSKLHLSLSSNLQLKSKNDVINMNTNVKFDAPIAIAYPIKSSDRKSVV